MRRKQIGSSRLAKFGIFKPVDTADVLLTARDAKGKPLMTYAEATARLNDFADDRHALIIRKVSNH